MGIAWLIATGVDVNMNVFCVERIKIILALKGGGVS